MHTLNVTTMRGRFGVAAAAILTATLWSSPAQAFIISTAPNGTATQGWDGAGLGSATIDWYLGWSDVLDPLNGLPNNGPTLGQVEAAIQAAMATWSAVVNITWNYLGNSVANPDPDPFGGPGGTNPVLNIYWDNDDHGDGFSFDGAWNPSAPGFNVFAHAWGPPDIEQSVFNGNIHMDSDELWVTSGATIGTNSATLDIQTIILHELGHSLGLDHSNVGGSTMAALYTGEDRALADDDIAGVRSLYACVGVGCPGGDPDPDPDPNPVPEPGSLTLLGLAFAFGFGKSRFVR